MGSQKSGAVVSVDTFLESSLESVDAAESTVIAAAERMGFPEDEVFRIGMAVREAVVNAVVHGNRYNANKRVHLVVSRQADTLGISIRDEGEGFLSNSQPDPLAAENLLRQSGRGIMIIRAFMDEMEVRPLRGGGMEVILKKTLPAAG